MIRQRSVRKPEKPSVMAIQLVVWQWPCRYRRVETE